MELPVLFEERMRRMLPPEEYEQFLKSYEREQYHALRVNTLKIRRKEFLERGLFDLEPVPWCENGFYYGENERPGKHPFHEAGLYYIQEPSAMSAAALADVQPGEYVLDLCAAPGGKSTQLASALQGQGLLVANEIHPARAKILSQNIERMGVRNALVTNETPQSLALRFPAFFDRIIVDAPCSGEGMFFKEEQALIHWSPENVQMCASRQDEILEEAAKMLAPGGTLVYSTCTFAPEEDEGQHGTLSERAPGILGEEGSFAGGLPSRSPGVGGWPRRAESDLSSVAACLKGGRALRSCPAEGGRASGACFIRKSTEGGSGGLSRVGGVCGGESA